MKRKKADNLAKSIQSIIVIKLSKDLWEKLINHIGKKIYKETVDILESSLFAIEREYRFEQREEFFISAIDFYRESIDDYFRKTKFPQTNIDYLNKKVEIVQNDVENLLLMLFNPAILDKSINRNFDFEPVAQDKKLTYVEDVKELMKLLKTPFKKPPIDDFIRHIFFKGRKKNEFEFPTLTILDYIKNIFTDTAIYSELHNIFIKEQVRGSKFIQLKNYIENNHPRKMIIDQNESIRLEMFFESIPKYKYIMELLVLNEFCQSNTYLWSDEKKSNKGTVISVLKTLHILGYYKENKKLRNGEIQKIAKNTFGINISISLIKQHKTNPQEVKFIPIASCVP